MPQTGHDALSLPASQTCASVAPPIWKLEAKAAGLCGSLYTSDGAGTCPPGIRNDCTWSVWWGGGRGGESHVRWAAGDVARTMPGPAAPNALKACVRAEQGTGLGLWIKRSAWPPCEHCWKRRGRNKDWSQETCSSQGREDEASGAGATMDHTMGHFGGRSYQTCQ